MLFLGQAPHDWLFPRCAALIHHGGAGTTATGLYYGQYLLGEGVESAVLIDKATASRATLREWLRAASVCMGGGE